MAVYGSAAVRDRVKKMSDDAKKNGVFVRLSDDRDYVLFACLPDPKSEKGEPFQCLHEVVWKDGKSEPYDPEKHKGENPKGEIRVAVYTVEIGNKESKQKTEVKRIQILAMNQTTYQDFCESTEKDQCTRFYQMTRSGKKNSKKTKYSMQREDVIVEPMLADIKAMRLPDLEASGGDDTEESDDSSKSAPKDGPITDDIANELIARMKPLGKGVGEEFCKQFHIKKVRELMQSQVGAATSWVVERAKPNGATVEEDNPFG